MVRRLGGRTCLNRKLFLGKVFSASLRSGPCPTVVRGRRGNDGFDGDLNKFVELVNPYHFILQKSLRIFAPLRLFAIQKKTS